MNFPDIVRSLGAWGYLNAQAIGNLLVNVWKEDGDVFKGAVRTFKERWGDKYGLPSGDHLDDDTVQLMSRRFCHCPDVMAVGEGLRRWGGNRITWRNAGVRVGSLSFMQAMDFTIKDIGKACNLTIVPVNSGGNLVSTSRRIDGPGRVLAQAYLPGFPTRLNGRLSQEYDTSETALSQHAFNLVTDHETGHSCGLEHDNTSEVALMDPFLNEALDGLQPADVRQFQLRYGPPVKPEPPTPPPQPPVPPVPEPEPGDKQVIQFELAGRDIEIRIDGYRVTKL